MSEQIEGKHLSTQEVMDALGNLSATDLIRLERLAKRHAHQSRKIDWKELLSESFARVVSGSRKWPRHLDWQRFFPGVMRSIADEMRVKARRGASRSTTGNHASDDSGRDIFETIPSADPPPEDILSDRETLAEIERLFENDEQCYAIIIGRTEGLSPAEIQEQFEMTPTEYASAQKRLRRTFLKHGLVKQP